MSATLEIAPADARDAAEVIALWQAAGLTRPWNDPTADFEQAIRGPHSVVLVGRLADRIVSTVMVGEDGHRGWVYYMGVHPQHQGRGLGRRMMEAAENWLRDRGVVKLNLMVRGSNADVRAFYDRLGYGLSDVVCLQKTLIDR